MLMLTMTVEMKGSLSSLLSETWNGLSRSTRGMSFKGEKSNSLKIAMVNQNRNREVAPDQNLDQNLGPDLSQGPDLDQNAGPSQRVKVAPDLDQTPGRDVEQNQEADHLRTNPGPGHLRRLNVVPGHLQKVPVAPGIIVVGVPAELEEINPGHPRTSPGLDLQKTNLYPGLLEENPNLDHPRTSPGQLKLGPGHLRINLGPGHLEENPNLDHPRTNLGPGHLKLNLGLDHQTARLGPVHLMVNPGPGHQRTRPGPDLHPIHLTQEVEAGLSLNQEVIHAQDLPRMHK